MSNIQIDKLECRYPKLFRIVFGLVTCWICAYIVDVFFANEIFIWFFDEPKIGCTRWVNLLDFLGVIFLSLFSLVLFASVKDSLIHKIGEERLYNSLMVFLKNFFDLLATM